MSRLYSPTFGSGYRQPSLLPPAPLERDSAGTCLAVHVRGTRRGLSKTRNGPTARTGIMFVVKMLAWSRRCGSHGTHSRA